MCDRRRWWGWGCGEAVVGMGMCEGRRWWGWGCGREGGGARGLGGGGGGGEGLGGSSGEGRSWWWEGGGGCVRPYNKGIFHGRLWKAMGVAGALTRIWRDWLAGSTLP